MTRSVVFDAFSTLAEMLHQSFAVEDLLRVVVRECDKVFPAAGGVVLFTRGRERLTMSAASTETAGHLGRVEILAGRGPSEHAHRRGRHVLIEDVQDCGDRWPALVSAAGRGCRSVLALPVHWGSRRLGVLTIWQRHAGPMRRSDVEIAEAFADVAAVGMVYESAADARQRARQLRHALAVAR